MSYFSKNSTTVFSLLWWATCLIASVLIDNGRAQISQFTYFVVCLFLGAVFLGYSFNFRNTLQSAGCSIGTCHISKRVIFAVSFVTLSMVYLTFLYFVNIGDGVYMLRAKLFTEESPIYPNRFLLYYFNWFVYPILLAILIQGAALRRATNNSALFLIATTLMVLKSFLENGRFPLYYVIVMLLFSTDWASLKERVGKYLLGFVAIALSFAGILYFITYLRAGDEENVIDVLFDSVFLYHTLSFNLLDYYMNDTGGIFQSYTFGLSSWLAVFDPAVAFLHWLGLDAVPESGVIGAELDKFIDIASSESGREINVNAFGTIILQFYRDGGVLFIGLSGFLIGALLAYSNRLKDPVYGYALNYLVGISLVMGVFLPILNFQVYVTLFVIIFFNHGKASYRNPYS